MGVATAISTTTFKDIDFSRRDISRLKEFGFEKIFYDSLRKIDELKMFDKIAVQGWTSNLGKKTKDILIPEIIKVVTLAWYQASMDSMDKQ
jgi:hypothetical protein